MKKCNFKIIEQKIEVYNFQCAPGEYTALTSAGKFKLLKCKSIQPPIENPDDFYTYLWAQAEDRYFVFRQRFEKGVSGSWEIFQEIIPEDTGEFFSDFVPVLNEMLEKGRKANDDRTAG